MTCSFCEDPLREPESPYGWRTCGSLIASARCRGREFRLKRITARVEPVGASCQELSEALNEAFDQAPALLIRDSARELFLTERAAVIRTTIGNRCWSLVVDTDHWSGGRKDAWRKVLSGEAVVGELLLYREHVDRGRHSKAFPNYQGSPFMVLCRMFLWLRSERREESCPRHLVLQTQEIELMDINLVRRAVRANRVSFPAQVPSFPGAYRPDLQRKVVQLYFVMGWSFPKIADRCRLTRSQTRRILNEWKQRAVRAGYVQHIPAPGQTSHAERSEAEVFVDRRVISGLQAGNENAYAWVIDRFQNDTYNLAYRLLGNQPQAERVTEEAFLELFRNCGSLGGGAALKTRLYQSVVTESARRSSGSRGHDPTASASPLEQALQVLHPLLRFALVLKEIEDMSYEEVAEVLKVAVSTVKSRVAEAREALSKAMAEALQPASEYGPGSAVPFLYPPIDSHASASAKIHSAVI